MTPVAVPRSTVDFARSLVDNYAAKRAGVTPEEVEQMALYYDSLAAALRLISGELRCTRPTR